MTVIDFAKLNPRAMVITAFFFASGMIGGVKFAVGQANTLEKIGRDVSLIKDGMYKVPELREALEEAAAERDKKSAVFK
jgi:hypothetical protein